MSLRLPWASRSISSSLVVFWAAAVIVSAPLSATFVIGADYRVESLLEKLRSADQLTQELIETKIAALGTTQAPALAAAVLAAEDRVVQVRLERSLRRVVVPLVQAWRAAVKPGGGGEGADSRRDALDERATRVERELVRLGPAVWPLFHRLRMCGPIELAKEATRFLGEAARDREVPKSADTFARVHYFWAPALLLREDDPRAQALINEHLKSTLQDFTAGASILRNRAEEEFCLLGDPALRFLGQVNAAAIEGLEENELERLKERVSWRVWPELSARTGLSMEGWGRLSWREKAALVSLWKRIGGEDAVPLLRRIHVTEQEEAIRRAAEICLLELGIIEGKWPRQNLRVLIVLAKALRSRGDVDQALKFFWQVVEKLPKDRLARYELAFTLHVAKQYDEAIRQFRRSLALEGGTETLVYLAWYNMACAYALSGRQDEAIEALLKAVETGYREREHLEVNDTDLESLRRLPAFRTVLEALDKARAAEGG